MIKYIENVLILIFIYYNIFTSEIFMLIKFLENFYICRRAFAIIASSEMR